MAVYVHPENYALTMTPDFHDFTFTGHEVIAIDVLKPTLTLTMNAVELGIGLSTLTLEDGTVFTQKSVDIDEKAETVSFNFGVMIPAGKATLEIEFDGVLNDKLRGFYRSQYTAQDGATKYLATTQFEATDARRAFPCWDEPAMKAKFNLTLIIPANLVAVSNTSPVEVSSWNEYLKKIRFAETPPMSTYLLAFIIGDLRSIEKNASNNTLIRVWSTAGNESKGAFALDVSVKLLEYFNDYFGIPYPLEKLDHIAIPDFAAGAMENWGAITYREIALLVDEKQSSAATRQRVATIVAHEMAHMWFGDLVTMAWWNDLWLNESFASWMGDKAVNHLFPEWQMWTQFIAEDTSRALQLDGLQNSHPVEQKVSNPSEIGELFDAISYSKGGSILRMLEDYVGSSDFQLGLNKYMTDHKYSNARTTDLWDALEASSKLPVRAMMDSWVNQTGYPVIAVNTECGQDHTTLTIRQERFLYEKTSTKTNNDQIVWHVPFSVKSQISKSLDTFLIQQREDSISLRGTSNPRGGWIKINPGQTGFYRVNYNRRGWERLITPIESLELPAADRLGIQNDAFGLSMAGMLPVTQFLTLAQAYKNETDASVWGDLVSNLGSLDSILSEEPCRQKFQELARVIIKPSGKRSGWDTNPEDGHLDSLLRSTLIGALGHYGDEETLKESEARFEKYIESPENIHPDIRTVVLRLAAKRGNKSTYSTMWDKYNSATLEEEKVRVLQALTQFKDTFLLHETLERSLTKEVRVHDAVSVVAGVGSSPEGRGVAWDFLKENWGEYDRRYGEGGFALMRLVSMTSGFSSQEQLDDVAEFFKENIAPAAERTVRQSLESIRINISWLDLNRQDLTTWLSEN